MVRRPTCITVKVEKGKTTKRTKIGGFINLAEIGIIGLGWMYASDYCIVCVTSRRTVCRVTTVSIGPSTTSKRETTKALSTSGTITFVHAIYFE